MFWNDPLIVIHSPEEGCILEVRITKAYIPVHTIYWVMCDTGSTDNTCDQEVRQIFPAEKNRSGRSSGIGGRMGQVSNREQRLDIKSIYIY